MVYGNICFLVNNLCLMVIFDKGVKDLQWSKNSFFNTFINVLNFLRKLDRYMQKMKQDHQLTSHTHKSSK